MYLCIDSPAFERMEPVWKNPDIPPKESNWIALTYLLLTFMSDVDKRLIPFVISKFPSKIVSINGICITKYVIILVMISVVIENRTMYPQILISDSKPLMIPESIIDIFS